MLKARKISLFIAIVCVLSTLFTVPSLAAETHEVRVVKNIFETTYSQFPTSHTVVDYEYGYITVTGPLPAQYYPGPSTIYEDDFYIWVPAPIQIHAKQTAYHYYIQDGQKLFIH